MQERAVRFVRYFTDEHLIGKHPVAIYRLMLMAHIAPESRSDEALLANRPAFEVVTDANRDVSLISDASNAGPCQMTGEACSEATFAFDALNSRGFVKVVFPKRIDVSVEGQGALVFAFRNGIPLEISGGPPGFPGGVMVLRKIEVSASKLVYEVRQGSAEGQIKVMFQGGC